MAKKFYICGCFLTDNFFLRELKLHVNYYNDDQFFEDYSEIIKKKTSEDITCILKEVKEQLIGRKSFHDERTQRKKKIKELYQPIHPQLYNFSEDNLTEEFINLVKNSNDVNTTKENMQNFMKKHGQSIYSFPVFKKSFCKDLLEELKAFEESPLPKSRPNTMNNYGINLDEIGFEEFISTLRMNYINPIAKLLYPEWGGGDLDSHKAFIVTYKEGQDIELSHHYDNAEVTLNVCLNDNFSEGDLYFGGMHGKDNGRISTGYSHHLGEGVLHRGQQMHGALPITEGERYNLIVWCRSSSVRNNRCPMCQEVPDLIPVEDGFGDGFTQEERNFCAIL